MSNVLLENRFVFSGRGAVPWNGIGASLKNITDQEEAIKKARLNWAVEQTPICTQTRTSQAIPGYVANVRSDTKEVLGIVSERYRVAQNEEMFAFADELIGNGETPCSYETAGSIFGGRRVFMLVNMPKALIMEDEYQP